MIVREYRASFPFRYLRALITQFRCYGRTLHLQLPRQFKLTSPTLQQSGCQTNGEVGEKKLQPFLGNLLTFTS